MTRLRWTEPASADFLGIVEWLKARNPAAAARVGRRILDDAEQLANFPYLGKPGRSPDTRELVVTKFPYHAVEHEAAALNRRRPSLSCVCCTSAMRWPPDEPITP
jgi:toxin ParE1/3/4